MFKTVTWDKDAAGDATCSAVFKVKNAHDGGQKQLNGKVKKKGQKKNNANSVKHIDNNIGKSGKRPKKKKVKTNGVETEKNENNIDTIPKKKKIQIIQNILIKPNGNVEINNKPEKDNSDNSLKGNCSENNKSNDNNQNIVKKKQKKVVEKIQKINNIKEKLNKKQIKLPKKLVEKVNGETSNNASETVSKSMKRRIKRKNKLNNSLSSINNSVVENNTPNIKNKKKKSNVSPKKADPGKTGSQPVVKTGKTLAKLSKRSEKRRIKMLKLRESLQNNMHHQDKTGLSLRERMMAKLKAARFRYLNEQIYTTDSKEAQNLFKTDPDAFQAYHEGYKQQVQKWPINPVDVIISAIKKMPSSHVIADFGCGEAKLARSVSQTVHSFDLVAVNEEVVACDMANVPLEDQSVDVAVFCLSLMGTNLHDYLFEANRVLKQGGVMKIAEVESRFDDVDNFIQGVERFGFKKSWKDLSHNLFYFIDFKKETTIKNKKKLPTISLHPCLYKKR